MKVLSLFSGIGGFEIACEWAGMEVVGQVEIDPFCQKVLAKHWPHVKRMSDIKQVRGDEFGTINIIVGGVPCQPASVAGKRRGTEDDRWLWPEAIRIIRVVRPRWCVFENPPGILSLQGGFRSTTSYLKWKEKVTKSGRIVFQLAASVRRTGGKGYSSWHTPRAGNPGSRKPGTGGEVLAEEAKRWATPQSRDYRAEKMWPTPTEQCSRGASAKGRQGGPNLQTAVMWPTQKGQLSAAWVECLMGFPQGWTELDGPPDQVNNTPGNRHV